MPAESVSYTAAFLTGMLSFFTPCILPLVPAYFTFITGFSLDELTDDPGPGIRKKVILSTIAFILGFSFVFILLGASASYFGGLMVQYRDPIRIIGGIIIILMGVHLTGIIRLKPLDLEKRLHIRKKPLHFAGVFIVGMAFAAGWSPCLGPLIVFNLSVSATMGSILYTAGSPETIWLGIRLLGTFSAGLAIPFMILSIFINLILVFLKRISKYAKHVNFVTGTLLILVGISLIIKRFII
jgi:cytochrome c-type biogenesis protein